MAEAGSAPGPGMAQLARRMRLRVLALMALLALGVALAGWQTVAWPGNAVLTVVLLAPLALPLPGILRADRRTFAWATLCVAPYFVFGLTELVANPAVRAFAGATVLTSLALVAALVAYLRLTRPATGAADAQ